MLLFCDDGSVSGGVCEAAALAALAEPLQMAALPTALALPPSAEQVAPVAPALASALAPRRRPLAAARQRLGGSAPLALRLLSATARIALTGTFAPRPQAPLPLFLALAVPPLSPSPPAGRAALAMLLPAHKLLSQTAAARQRLGLITPRLALPLPAVQAELPSAADPVAPLAFALAPPY